MNLPSIFQNKKININNIGQNLYYGKEEAKVTNTTQRKDIRNEIKKLFSSRDYIYKIDCIITTSKDTFNTYIIGKTNNNLITIDNERIPIKDIIDIKKKKG